MIRCVCMRVSHRRQRMGRRAREIAIMERNNFRVLLFRFHPYIAAGAETGPKQEIFCAKKLSMYPPLGLAQLAAVLRQAGYMQVKVVDAWAENLPEIELLRMVERFDPHLVGCTLWTTSFKRELSVLRKIKKRVPDAYTVVGGPHLDVYAAECMESAMFVDFGVVGEGEETAVELFDAIRSGNASFDGIRGIVYRSGTKPVFTGWRPPPKELDGLPFPDFSGLPMGKYYSELERTAPYIYIFSTRGCQYRCRYCFNSRGRTFRAHSVDYTIDYINFLKQRYGIREIGFWDETFTFNKQRTLEFCRRYTQEGIGLPYTVRTRVNHVDEEILRNLKESGCSRVHYGIESGSQEVLDRMNRKMTLVQARQAIALTKECGLPVATNFMIGYLDESRETYESTIRFAKELNPDHVNLFVTTVLPGTNLYFQALERGILKRDVWREYALGKLANIDIRTLRLPGKDYSVDDLEKMAAEAYRRIFFRPTFVLKKLRSLRSPQQLRRYSAQAMGMIISHLPRPVRVAMRK